MEGGVQAGVPGPVQGRVLRTGEGVDPFNGLLRHDAQFDGRVGPFERERDRTTGLRGRQNGLAIDQVGSPLLGHQRVQGPDEGTGAGELKFACPDKHPDFETGACGHTSGGTFRVLNNNTPYCPTQVPTHDKPVHSASGPKPEHPNIKSRHQPRIPCVDSIGPLQQNSAINRESTGSPLNAADAQERGS